MLAFALALRDGQSRAHGRWDVVQVTIDVVEPPPVLSLVLLWLFVSLILILWLFVCRHCARLCLGGSLRGTAEARLVPGKYLPAN